MRIFITVILIFVLIGCQSSDNELSKGLSIIGTVHFPTPGVNADSIYQAIKMAKPDVILLERDSTAFDDNFKPLFDDQENESLAIKRYLKEHPDVSIRPIEFEGRNSYRVEIGLFPQANEVYQKLNEMARSGQFSNQQQEIWDQFAQYWMQMDSLSSESLKALNTKYTDKLLEKAKQIQYTEMKKLVNARDEYNKLMLDARGDSISLKDYFNKWEQFEHYERNNAMVANTIRTMNSMPKQKFVLIVGYHHRYYIKNKIEKQSPEIILSEYYN
ncbi:hypothetical protein K8354_15985 [Polaribacter litorisediminis]|uniref:hypothetical protein n=1 Tax=Polaribacter litorisediminis TaxID=1908341 RepID=UPI001CBF187E|nr:hypothetical protein [Polaribacter litorisediminis]UAM97774.1 hypothetical protein K8354_15985 [Polaribacter litorisediminis]